MCVRESTPIPPPYPLDAPDGVPLAPPLESPCVGLLWFDEMVSTNQLTYSQLAEDLSTN